jgi:hypothetical protein
VNSSDQTAVFRRDQLPAGCRFVQRTDGFVSGYLIEVPQVLRFAG